MADKFTELCTAFKDIGRLTENDGWAPLVPWPPIETAMTKYVDAYSGQLPPGYDKAYLRPLMERMPVVASRLADIYNSRLDAQLLPTRALSDATLHADSLIGAATAWSNSAMRRRVQQFAAVVSDLFESFVTKSHPVLQKLDLGAKYPPLVTFATEPARGPATLNADVVKDYYCVADISIVSQPIGYADHPMLWGVLAHETAGHAVTHAIPGLAKELTEKVPKTAGLSSYGADLWQHWAEEAVADIYGLLNIGPSFAIGLAAWLKMTKNPPGMGTSVRFVAGKPDDDHPPDLLRLYLLKGAIAQLKDFDDFKNGWLGDIQAAIESAACGVADIDFYYTDPLSPHPRPLALLGLDAEKIGAAIVTMPLCALMGHSISEIETWNKDDEKIALKVKQAAMAKRPLTCLDADDAHLLAGVTMALCDDASLYHTLNLSLNEAFAQSYANDRAIRQLREKAD
jgi:hypothetical protein